MKLLRLHEEFIDKARRPMSFGRLPIIPTKDDLAIIPVNKWEKKESPVRLQKTFLFRDVSLRNRFLQELLDHEQEVGHHAKITLDKESVVVELRTKDVNQVTELDKEYSRFADLAFKDVVYNPVNE